MSGEIDKLFLNSVPEGPQSAEADTIHGKIVVAAVPVPVGSKAAVNPTNTVTQSSQNLRDVVAGNQQVGVSTNKQKGK